MGQKLLSFVAGFEAPDAKTIRMTLKEPYGLVLQTLAKPGANVPFMMPKRVADTDPNKQITDFTGSGPFIFRNQDWKAGEKAVYVKNPKYKPRSDPASGLAGGKVVKVDRVEWLWIADTQTQIDALTKGEIDYIEAPPHDLLPLLQKDQNVELLAIEPVRAPIRLPLQHAAQAVRQPEDPPGGRLCAEPARTSSMPRSAIRNGTANASRCSPAARRSNRPPAGTTSSPGTPPRRGSSCRRRAMTARRSCSCSDRHRGAEAISRRSQSSSWRRPDSRSTCSRWTGRRWSRAGRRRTRPRPAAGTRSSRPGRRPRSSTRSRRATSTRAATRRPSAGRATPRSSGCATPSPRRPIRQKQKAIAEAVQRRAAEAPTHVHLGQYVPPVAYRKSLSGVLVRAEHQLLEHREAMRTCANGSPEGRGRDAR